MLESGVQLISADSCQCGLVFSMLVRGLSSTTRNNVLRLQRQRENRFTLGRLVVVVMMGAVVMAMGVGAQGGRL